MKSKEFVSDAVIILVIAILVQINHFVNSVKMDILKKTIINVNYFNLIK